jgi:hypothetical protein
MYSAFFIKLARPRLENIRQARKVWRKAQRKSSTPNTSSTRPSSRPKKRKAPKKELRHPHCRTLPTPIFPFNSLTASQRSPTASTPAPPSFVSRPHIRCKVRGCPCHFPPSSWVDAFASFPSSSSPSSHAQGHPTDPQSKAQSTLRLARLAILNRVGPVTHPLAGRVDFNGNLLPEEAVTEPAADSAASSRSSSPTSSSHDPQERGDDGDQSHKEVVSIFGDSLQEAEEFRKLNKAVRKIKKKEDLRTGSKGLDRRICRRLVILEALFHPTMYLLQQLKLAHTKYPGQSAC